jgi:hypothetical protein
LLNEFFVHVVPTETHHSYFFFWNKTTGIPYIVIESIKSLRITKIESIPLFDLLDLSNQQELATLRDKTLEKSIILVNHLSLKEYIEFDSLMLSDNIADVQDFISQRKS